MIDHIALATKQEASPGPGVSEDVLVIEATPSLAEILEYALSNAGMRIRVLSNGAEAQSYLEGLTKTPKVVLVDLDLRGVDGFAYLRRLVASAPTSQVVVISVHGAERDQIRALRAGAIDYFPKPISVGLLVAKIERLLDAAKGS